MEFYVSNFIQSVDVATLRYLILGITLLSIAVTILLQRKKKHLPPFNPDNIFETIKIFTGTKNVEYVLATNKYLGNIFTCKFTNLLILLPTN